MDAILFILGAYSIGYSWHASESIDNHAQPHNKKAQNMKTLSVIIPTALVVMAFSMLINSKAFTYCESQWNMACKGMAVFVSVLVISMIVQGSLMLKEGEKKDSPLGKDKTRDYLSGGAIGLGSVGLIILLWLGYHHNALGSIQTDSMSAARSAMDAGKRVLQTNYRDGLPF
jgi:hypothetical protein